MAIGEHLIQEAIDFQSRLAGVWKLPSDLNEVQVGTTPKDIVYSEDKLVLYKYRPLRKKTAGTDPILIVYALVNRPYIADLNENRSLVRGLLEQGQEVYLIDWGYPSSEDRYLDLHHYIEGYIANCVKSTLQDSKSSRLNILGICQGGTMSLCYAALHPEKVHNIITMVTPVDFSTPDNLLAHWFSEVDIDLFVDTVGNIPGMMLNSMFLSLKPFRLGVEKYIDLSKILDNPDKIRNFMQMEKWIFDSPDQAGEMFRTFVKQFSQQNKLVKGEILVAGKRVDLKKIKNPVLNLYAKQDHLVPPSSSQALRTAIGSEDYKEIGYDTGHIGIYVSSKAGRDIPRKISSWLGERN